jgi:hypothetical protein
LEKNPGGHAKLRTCFAKEKTICSQYCVNKDGTGDMPVDLLNLKDEENGKSSYQINIGCL